MFTAATGAERGRPVGLHGCIGVVSVSHSLQISRRRCKRPRAGRLARRNVNTGRPISLISPIRSNARHSPTLYTVARKARRRYTFLNRGIVRTVRICARTPVYIYTRVCTESEGAHAGRFEKDIASAFRASRSLSITRVNGQIYGIVTRETALYYISRDSLYGTLQCSSALKLLPA